MRKLPTLLLILACTSSAGADDFLGTRPLGMGGAHRAIVNHFLALPVPDGWRKHPLLRNYRLAVFTNNICSLADSPYTLWLSRELGLEIQKEVQ